MSLQKGVAAKKPKYLVYAFLITYLDCIPFFIWRFRLIPRSEPQNFETTPLDVVLTLVILWPGFSQLFYKIPLLVKVRLDKREVLSRAIFVSIFITITLNFLLVYAVFDRNHL